MMWHKSSPANLLQKMCYAIFPTYNHTDCQIIKNSKII